MNTKNKHFKKHFIAFVVFLLAITTAGYYEFKSYEKDKQLDIERKETSQRIREQARVLSEEMRKHPIAIPVEGIEQEGNPLSTSPSDAEEITQIQQWHRSSRKDQDQDTRNILRAPIRNEGYPLNDSSTNDAALNESPDSSEAEKQALQSIQKQVLSKKRAQE